MNTAHAPRCSCSMSYKHLPLSEPTRPSRRHGSVISLMQRLTAWRAWLTGAFRGPQSRGWGRRRRSGADG
eukprot:1031295-Pyramimonas_sp.AAC.1